MIEWSFLACKHPEAGVRDNVNDSCRYTKKAQVFCFYFEIVFLV